MIKGIIEHRATQRVPFEHIIQIRFIKDNETMVIANTVDISAGGLQFSIPWGKELFHPGDIIEIIFKGLTFIGDMTVASEIKYERPGIDLDYNRLLYYGAKFLDLSLDAWNAIVDYTQTNPSPPVPALKKEPVERKDIRVTTCLNAEISLADSSRRPVVVEDISYGGVKIRISEPLDVDEPVTLILDSEGRTLEIFGSCAWSGADRDNRFVAGIFFNKLSLDEYNALRGIIFKVRDSAQIPG